jgi:hypothetical protein
MNNMARVVCEWFAKELESSLVHAVDSQDAKVLSFCREKIYPIYGEAVKQTEGQMQKCSRIKSKFELSVRDVRDLAFESEQEVEGMLLLGVHP